MDPNLTNPIILNATIMQPQGSANITLIAASVGAIAALIGSLISNVTYYFLAKRRFNEELRLRLREDRKKLYEELINELNEFKRTLDEKYNPAVDLSKGINSEKDLLALADSVLDDPWKLRGTPAGEDLHAAFYTLIKKFSAQLNLVADSRIAKELLKIQLMNFCINPEEYNKSLSQIQSLMRIEFVPI